MRLFGRAKPQSQTLAFLGAPPATAPTAEQAARPDRSKPNVGTLAREEDVDGLVEAASFEDPLPGRDGETVDLGAQVRREAILALGDLAAEDGNETVAGALTDPSDKVRVAAVRVLHAREDAVALAEALAWLPADSGDSRRLALRALTLLANPESAPTLAAALVHARGDDPVGDDETALLATLVQLEESSEAMSGVMQELLSALADERAVVADRAEDLLAALAPGSMHALISELKGGAAPHRAAAVLGRTTDPRALDPLLEALEHSDPRVRAESAAALGELRDPVAVEPLLRATRDPDHDVRAQAGWALDSIGTVAVVVGVSHLVRSMIKDAVASALDGRPARGQPTPAPAGDEHPDDADELVAGGPSDPTTLRRLEQLLDGIEDPHPDQPAKRDRPPRSRQRRPTDD